MKIYTKTGDQGETSLYGGKRLPKSDLRLEAYGSVDELNSALGVCLAQDGSAPYAAALTSVQQTLFLVGAELASAAEAPTGLTLVSDQEITNLEQAIDRWQAELPKLTNFILPGGHLLASHLHLARTVARRAERAVVRLSQEQPVRPVLLKYLNRLSDYLFVMARQVNHQQGAGEVIWRAR